MGFIRILKPKILKYINLGVIKDKIMSLKHSKQDPLSNKIHQMEFNFKYKTPLKGKSTRTRGHKNSKLQKNNQVMGREKPLPQLYSLYRNLLAHDNILLSIRHLKLRLVCRRKFFFQLLDVRLICTLASGEGKSPGILPLIGE